MFARASVLLPDELLNFTCDYYEERHAASQRNGGHFDAESQSHRTRAAAKPSFVWYTPTCAARYTQKEPGANVSIAWMDSCTRWGKVTNDGDRQRDHWVFKQYATCKGVGNWALSLCEIGSYRTAGTSTLSWEDWAPRADSSGSCRSTSLSVSAHGIGVSGSFTACENLDITKGAAGANFKSAWRGWVINSERATQYQIAFGVENGKRPNLTVPFTVNAKRR